jgi:hypothetical protein
LGRMLPTTALSIHLQAWVEQEQSCYNWIRGIVSKFQSHAVTTNLRTEAF